MLAANEYQSALDLNKLYPEIDEEIIQERLFKLLKHKLMQNGSNSPIFKVFKPVRKLDEKVFKSF